MVAGRRCAENNNSITLLHDVLCKIKSVTLFFYIRVDIVATVIHSASERCVPGSGHARMAVVGSGGYHLSRSEVLFCAESSPPSQSDLDVRWGCRRLQRDLILRKRESQIRSVSYTHQSGPLAGGGWRDRRLLAVAAQIDRYVQYRQTPSRGAFGIRDSAVMLVEGGARLAVSCLL